MMMENEEGKGYNDMVWYDKVICDIMWYEIIW